METSGITILGLGPGGAELLTLQAWNWLEGIPELYLRTSEHPAVSGLPSHITIHSFDDVYKKKDSFELVYEEIIDRILELGKRPEGVTYAVPGHPFVAEATCPEIMKRARKIGIPVTV